MVKEKFTIGPSNDAIAIREEVFVKEQGFANEIDDLDPTSISLVLYLDDYPISTGRLVKVDPETYRIGRVAVRKQFRGNKIGTYTVKYLCNKAIQLGARYAILDSQIDKMGFYKKIGFRPITGEVFLEEGYPHVAMKKQIVKIKNKANQ